MLEVIRQIICSNDGNKVFITENGKKTTYILRRDSMYSLSICDENGEKTDYTLKSLIQQCLDDSSSVELEKNVGLMPCAVAHDVANFMYRNHCKGVAFNGSGIDNIVKEIFDDDDSFFGLDDSIFNHCTTHVEEDE